ncbi:MAG: YkvA family protein, partial [Aquabacterium sp.]
KSQVVFVYMVARDAETPWFARLTAGLTVAYALSPIDLIPDFVPVLGLLDDVLIVPLGIWLALRLTPDGVKSRCRLLVDEWLLAQGRLPSNQIAGVVVVLVWLALAAGLAFWAWPSMAT